MKPTISKQSKKELVDVVDELLLKLNELKDERKALSDELDRAIAEFDAIMKQRDKAMLECDMTGEIIKVMRSRNARPDQVIDFVVVKRTKSAIFARAAGDFFGTVYQFRPGRWGGWWQYPSKSGLYAVNHRIVDKQEGDDAQAEN